MCGIFGCYSPYGIKTPGIFADISNILKHRGPDDEGYISVSKNGDIEHLSGDDTIDELKHLKNIHSVSPNDNSIYLAGHRRLSIIDLTAGGHQPLSDEKNRFVFSFNGEIYNYVEIKKELIAKGFVFKSNSDTEVAFLSFLNWGLGCFEKFRGMWAISIYDVKEKKLILCRDRYGIKPLYYYKNDLEISYSSEIKGILPLVKDKKPNFQSIFDMIFFFQLDFNDESFFKNIYQVEPGFIYEFQNNDVRKENYYKIEIFENPLTQYSENLCKKNIIESIAYHLRSDVECGACLSGGVDSSIIAGISFKEFGKKLKTFSAVFPGEDIDESFFINDTVCKLKLDSKFCYPSENQFVNDLKKIIYYQDEPFPATSICAQWDVFKMASENKVKVMLDGQGADEIFGGYYSYFKYYFRQIGEEKGIYELIKGILKSRKVSVSISNYFLYSLLPEFVKKQIRIKHKISWANKEFVEFGYQNTNYNENDKLTVNEGLKKHITTTLRALLRYEDRNSMAYSIESRVPFLDHILVDQLFSISGTEKFNYDTNKIILRSIARNYVSDTILYNKKKIGFATPENSWLNGKKFEREFGSFYKNPLFMKKNGILSNDYKYNSLTGNQKWIITCVEVWADINKF